jgi:hypothetical protein
MQEDFDWSSFLLLISLVHLCIGRFEVVGICGLESLQSWGPTN